jgi:hypothetical protein
MLESGIVTTACFSVPDHRAQIPPKQRIWRI